MVLDTIFLIIASSSSILWSMFFIYFPIRKVNGNELTKLLNKLPKRASILNNDSIEGFIIGKWYIGYINITVSQHGEIIKTLYIWCSTKWYETYTKNINEIIISEEKKITINLFERCGNYFHIDYIKRQFNITNYISRPSQEKIINNIISFYNDKNYCVVLLYGDKGTGKSMIPILLSKEFKNVNFCDTFKPYEPGNNFSSLYNKTNPDKNSPLIVVLEEFDIIIDKIHYNKIVNHKYIPTEITDKSSWNLFFDRFDRGYYPHVILILTSNIKPTFINNLDESYIREGRVNLLFEVIL